jgi:maleate isomerase
VEVEMVALAPASVSVHFTRMVAHGEVGAHAGLEERSRQQVEHIGESVRLLAMVKPKVIVLAHTATSALLGREGEAALVARMEREHKVKFVTAFQCVFAALARLGIGRVALGAPYDAAATLKSKAFLEANGIGVVSHGNLENVRNIYDETAARARALARRIDAPAAQAVYLSGLGMPTIAEIEAMERDLGKPVVSAAVAMMWHALRVAGHTTPIRGFGRLLAGEGA